MVTQFPIGHSLTQWLYVTQWSLHYLVVTHSLSGHSITFWSLSHSVLNLSLSGHSVTQWLLRVKIVIQWSLSHLVVTQLISGQSVNQSFSTQLVT